MSKRVCSCGKTEDIKKATVRTSWCDGGYGEPEESYHVTDTWYLCNGCRNKAYHMLKEAFGPSEKKNKKTVEYRP